MVRLNPSTDAAAFASEHQAALRQAPGRAGLTTLGLPPGETVASFLAILRSDPRVERASPSGRTAGVGGRCRGYVPDMARANPYQWFLATARAPSAGFTDLSPYVVAVLDTGLAYEDRSDEEGTFVAAESLAGVEVVAPWDFVHGDAHPNDDHGHGTHISSIIASDGEVEGVAAGVSLMPLKVLDEDNSGDEASLVEALLYAVDEGADVINLSLAFAEGYVPSRDLSEALRAAADAGVVVLAAAGNDGLSSASWPSASRAVISVGASSPASDGSRPITSYSNHSPELDLLAPGGDLDADNTCDGYGDGILAETIDPGDPSHTGLWFYAGTSQATAVATGAAVHLLARGVAPLSISAALQKGAQVGAATPFASGSGAGSLDIGASLTLTYTGAVPAPRAVHASLLPYIARDDDAGLLTPTAQIVVYDESGAPVEDAVVYGRLRSSEGDAALLSCEISAGDDGACEVVGDAVPAEDDDGAAAAVGWMFTVDAVVIDRVALRPGPLVFATDGLELLSAALAADADLAEGVLAFDWQQGEDDDLGPLAEATTLISLGAGLASCPLGLAITAPLMDQLMSSTTDALDLDGAGLSTDPLGVVPVTVRRWAGGAGLSTDPLGLTGEDLALVSLSGSGLSTDPLGFSARTLSLPVGGPSLGLGFDADPVFLSTGSSTADLSDTWLAARLESGGWESAAGYEPTALLVASEALGVGFEGSSAR